MNKDDVLVEHIRKTVRQASEYVNNVYAVIDQNGVIMEFGGDNVKKCVSAFLQKSYIRQSNGKFYERTPATSFRHDGYLQIYEVLRIPRDLSKCALKLLSSGAITVSVDDSPPPAVMELSSFADSGALVNPSPPQTLSEFGIIIDEMKLAINTFATEILCNDLSLMMKLLAIHTNISDEISLVVKHFMQDHKSHYHADIHDFNPFMLKGGNVFKIQKYLMETALDGKSDLSGMSDYDFSIDFPKMNKYNRYCNEKYDMNNYIDRNEIKDENKKNVYRENSDKIHYSLYSLIFRNLVRLIPKYLDKLPEILEARARICLTLQNIFDESENTRFGRLSLQAESAFCPLSIVKENEEYVFTCNTAMYSEPKNQKEHERLFKQAMREKSIIQASGGKLEGYRLLEMMIIDWSIKRQGFEEITKTGFKLLRAQVAFNVRIELVRDISFDKITFAEIFDYASPIMHTHDLCADYDVPDIISINGMNIQSHSIMWFIADILRMIDSGVESPKHFKRMGRIATLINLIFDPRTEQVDVYPRKKELTDFLSERSPRGYVYKDKILQLFTKYSFMAASDRKTANEIDTAAKILSTQFSV